MKKPLPKLETDEEAELFVAEADLTEYDLSGLRIFQFDIGEKDARIDLRLPKRLLAAVRAAAARAGISDRDYIARALERAVRGTGEKI